MGIFKFLLGPFNPFGPGLPIRPTTRRERYMRDSITELESLNNQLDKIATGKNMLNESNRDDRPRGTCPSCKELILVSATKCKHCGTEGITWSYPK